MLRGWAVGFTVQVYASLRFEVYGVGFGVLG